MLNLTIRSTSHKQVIDITERINEELGKLAAGGGICHIFVLHTTCCLTTADLDPGADQDLLDAVEHMFPQGRYRHPHDPEHVGEHIMSSLIGASLTVPVNEGVLVLGTWQRIVLVELSGPRERSLLLSYQSDKK